MKKIIVLAMLLTLGAISAQAAGTGDTIGFIYQNATTPGGGYTATADNKVGETTCKSFFHIVGTGDCAVETAMKNGKIKSLGGYDVKKKNIIGIQTITVRAWGN